MKEIIIIGAGAIGRGFLPWIFGNGLYDLVFVDSNKELIDKMRSRKKYSAYRAKNKKLEEMTVNIKDALLSSEFLIAKYPDAAAVFMCVGPRNAVAAAAGLKGARCPVILCENEPQTVPAVRGAIGGDNVYFAVPDVITSNTASPQILAKDPLSIITEDGIILVDDRAKGIKGNITFCSEDELINKHWTAKLYLHNTPHCITAYLGALVGARYIHESMSYPDINKIVAGSMNEMLSSLKLKWDIPHQFLDWYAEKELKRFSNDLLYDPISRVAREPLRKLELEGRLIGAAQICVSLGFIPHNILKGITSAILFEDENDTDHHLSFMRKVLPPQVLLTHILGLRKGEALEMIMRERLPKIISQLEELIRENKARK